MVASTREYSFQALFDHLQTALQYLQVLSIPVTANTSRRYLRSAARGDLHASLPHVQFWTTHHAALLLVLLNCGTL